MNLYFLIYWIVEFLKVKSTELLENKYLNKHCGKALRKLALFEWRVKNAATEGGARQAAEVLSAGLKKKEEYIIKEEEKEEKEENKQCEQKEQKEPNDQNEELPTFIQKLEDPSDITLGESDYNMKKLKRTGSFHNMFMRLRSPSTNLLLKDMDSNTNSATQSMLQMPKSSNILNDIESGTMTGTLLQIPKSRIILNEIESSVNTITGTLLQIPKSNRVLSDGENNFTLSQLPKSNMTLNDVIEPNVKSAATDSLIQLPKSDVFE